MRNPKKINSPLKVCSFCSPKSSDFGEKSPDFAPHYIHGDLNEHAIILFRIVLFQSSNIPNITDLDDKQDAKNKSAINDTTKSKS